MKPQPFTTATVQAILARLESQLGRATPTRIVMRETHSNHVAEVVFDTGRTLIIKQARYQEMNARFHTSRLAARLLREHTDVRTPEYLDISGSGQNSPLIYWRIPLDTLDTLWPRLQAEQRRHTLRTWGRLVRQIQRVRLPGHGPLLEAHERARPLSAFLRADLHERLRPAVASVWPGALAVIDRLVAMIDAVQERAGDRGGVLIHNDLFAANLLCEGTVERGVVCAGLIDFEDAFSGPPEAELAKTEILHGPLFGQPWSEDCMSDIVAGYGAPLDAFITAYFRVLHLLNMGYHAAATGLLAHAADVLDACRRELRPLGRHTVR